MGILDFIKATENKKLKQEIDELKNLLTPEQKEVKDMLNYLNELQEKRDILTRDIEKLKIELIDLENKKNTRKQELVILDEEILMQDFGLY